MFKWFLNLRIAVKLIIAFLVIAIIAGALGVYGVLTLNDQKAMNEQLFENYGNSQGYLGNILGELQSQRTMSAYMLLAEDEKKTEEYTKLIEESDKKIETYLAKYEKTCILADQKTALVTLKENINNYNMYKQSINGSIKLKNYMAAELLMTSSGTSNIAQLASDAAQKAVQDNVDRAQAEMKKTSEAVARSIYLMVGVAALAMIIAILFGFIIARIIGRPVRRVSAAADKLAAGDIDVELDVKTKDEVGKLAGSFNKLKETFRELIKEINLLSKNISVGELNYRADESKFEGAYHVMVGGVNTAIANVVNYYEIIPSPIMIMDRQLCLQYVNNETAKLLGKGKEELYGTPCAQSWNTALCNTDGCPCVQAMEKDEVVTCENTCEIDGKTMDIYCIGAPVKNSEGEIVGCFEFVTDQSDIKNAVRISRKQSEYQKAEVGKLLVNLERLSQGELYCDMEPDEPDTDTQEAYELFTDISTNLYHSIETIKGYITEIAGILGEVSKGNLSVDISSEYKGDFVALKEAINNIIVSLNNVLSNINTAAEQVASGSRQVSDGNQAISQGATEQASSIEELTVTIGQIAQQTKQNAMNANDASELASTAKQDALTGNEQMKGMQQAMEEISESSASIGKIIKVIDDIAFQTNILALNAAVEAARAGIHGKGFAVVAEEVRNLAAKSAKAAKETTALIESSIHKSDAGTRIADETATSLNNIVRGVERAAQLVEGIAQASNEQATGIAQINKGIEQMSQVVQNNSATAQEGAAASEELSSQADLLKSMVGQFQLNK